MTTGTEDREQTGGNKRVRRVGGLPAESTETGALPLSLSTETEVCHALSVNNSLWRQGGWNVVPSCWHCQPSTE